MSYKKLLYNLYLTNSIYNYDKILESSNVNAREEIEQYIINTKKLEIEYKLDKLNLIKFLYCYKVSVHKILYELEEVIELTEEGKAENLSYYFYLVLLINDSNTMFNYTYSIEYIKIINEKNKNNNDICSKIIMSKIILELIDNYIKFEDENGDINKMIEENNIILRNNANIFK